MRTRMLVLAMAGLSLFAAAQDADRGGASKLLALENAWNRAEGKGDVRALDLILDGAVVYVDEEGALQTKAQVLAQAKEAAAHLQSLVTRGMNVRIYGETAVVTGSYRTAGLQRGRPYQREGRFIDTWVFKQGTWVCVAAQATPILR